MAIEDDILKNMFKFGLLHDIDNKTIIGIAKQAKERGYDTLTERQKNCLASLFSRKCDGFIDPGGHSNNCDHIITGDDLNNAIRDYPQYHEILCEDCRDELSYIEYSKDKFFRD